MSEKIIYAKDSKIYCSGCGDHILTFNIDCFSGIAKTQELIKQDEGQAPWINGDIMKCRKCGKNYSL